MHSEILVGITREGDPKNSSNYDIPDQILQNPKMNYIDGEGFKYCTVFQFKVSNHKEHFQLCTNSPIFLLLAFHFSPCPLIFLLTFAEC
jgi:hypothetical protein